MTTWAAVFANFGRRCASGPARRPTYQTIVITGLVPVIRVLAEISKKERGWPGHRRAEATPFFERL
jgi:hypothetical protein